MNNIKKHEEDALAIHRQRTIPITRVMKGDRVEIAGWPMIVTESEPWSDHVWFLELRGHFGDGDQFETSVKMPADAKVKIRRKP